jgi:hypothetical protein
MSTGWYHRSVAKVISALLFSLLLSVAEGRELSSIGGFSLGMSDDGVESFARTRLGLQVVHTDDSLDLYRKGDDPDQAIPLAYFSYGDDGKIACMHFHLDIFGVPHIFTNDLLRILQSLYGIEQFRKRKLLGYPVFFHGHTKYGEYVSIHSPNSTKPSWINFCLRAPT